MKRPSHLLAAALILGLGACSALRPEPPIDRDAGYRLDRGLAALDAGQYEEAFEDLAWVYTHCPRRVRGAEALVAMAALELDPRNRAGRPGVATDLLSRVVREPTPPAYVRPLAESAYLMALALGAPAAAAAMPAGQPDPGGGLPSDVAADTVSAVGGAPAESAAARADSGAAAAPSSRGAVVRAAEVLEDPVEEPARGCGNLIDPEGWVEPRLPRLPGPSLVALLNEAERAREASAATAAGLRDELATVRQRLAETEAELERIRKTLRP